MQATYILGVDIGTGSVKAVAVNSAGLIFRSQQEFYPTQHPHPGWAEQDPDLILSAVILAISKIVVEEKIPPSAISLSSAMHSLVVVDTDGKSLTPLMIWSDARSSVIAEELRKSDTGKKIYEKTGTPIHSMSPLCKIMWLQQHHRGLLKERCKLISIKEFIWYQLFQEYVIDHSIASATGLFDIQTKCWHAPALQLAGIDESFLSHIVPTNYLKNGIRESLSTLLGIPPHTTFCIGASDGCLASLGTHALSPGVAAITIGTSGAVRIAGSHPLIHATIMNFNYLLDEQTYISGGPVNNGGNVIQWLLNNFLQQPVTEKSYHTLFETIEKIPAGCDGLIFLPYIHGERAPVWDEQSSGVYFGIRSNHDQPFFLRAALEGTCFALHQLLMSLEAISIPIHQVHVSGGFVHAKAWLQLLCDITGKKLTVYYSEDASATGAAFLAMKALHWINDYTSLIQPAAQELIPRKQFHEVYQKNFKIFSSLYPLLKDSMHTLHHPGQ